MDLIQTIKSAENQYKQILEGFFISVFCEESLPSHGLDHHRRVWNTACDLLQSMHAHGLKVTPNLTFSLIIASYLHDIGMVTDHGPKHGHHSANLCRKFLSDHSLDESDFPGMIEAIENHDNKDYPSSEDLNLQSLLSVADDLDAFGYTGIYRYLEIYILRGINPEVISGSIRKNAFSRFSHFELLFSFDEALVSKHKKRYDILDSFFMKYEKNEPCHKIGEILTHSLSSQRSIKSTITDNTNNRDNEVSMFFINLNSELSI